MSTSQAPGPAVACRRVGCNRPATHHLEFRAWAASAPKIAAHCVAGRIPQPLCKEHARSAQIGDVITPDGFQRIAMALRAQGRGLPAQDYSSILLFPVDGVPEITLAGLPAGNARH